MKFAFLLLAILPFSGRGQSLFTLVPPEKSGISFQNNISETATQNVFAYEYFYNGGGVAVGDLNNDGLPDIVFTSNMEQPRVYFNKGNFVFEDVSKKSKIHASGWKTGVTMADVNGDGWLDVYICRSGPGDADSRSNLLFINQKNGTFKEMAAEYGIDEKGNSTQAVFFDYDNDGDLDLFILNHSIKRYKNFDVAYMKSARDSVAGDKLYRNDGNDHFTEVSVKAGIIGNPICFGLGVAVADFNGDGWPDMYVTNDYDEDDYLYINQKDGTFKESLISFLGHTSKFSMGCDVADVNNDGLTDLLTLDMLPESNKRQKLLKGPDGYDHFQMLLDHGYYCQYMRNMLHLGTENNGQIGYSEIGQLAGISNTDWSWSGLFCDFDLDGWQDLFITNGYMRDYTNMDFLKYIVPEEIRKALLVGQKPDLFEMVKKMPSSQLKSYLFRNNGNLQFGNVTQQWGMGIPSLSNGAAYADLDNDGDWDLVVNNINQPAFIWQNHAEDLKNSYLKIKLSGEKKNTFGIGAKVIVSAADGFRQIQQLEAAHGFQSSMEPCLIFGLGKRQLATVMVIWPDGKKQVLVDQPVNRTMVLEQKNAAAAGGSGSLNGQVAAGAAAARAGAGFGVGGSGAAGAGSGAGGSGAGSADMASMDAGKMLFTELRADSLRWAHIEDGYNDFKIEPLLPHQYSRMGPALAVGDVNGDGKQDFFVGGAKGQPCAIFINEGNGQFSEKKIPVFQDHTDVESVQAIFADLDHDGDLDLYVVSGGNEGNFQDHIYWNDGKGNFSYTPGVLPVTASSGGAVVAFDMDGDGDLDIFRAGQVSTGAYPSAPQSYLFENSRGVFKDVTPDFLQHIGMVNTALVADINKDGVNDLILAGEFMPVTILYGQKTAPFFTAEHQLKIPHSTGWWNCLKIEDIDNDGDLDIIAGNEGLNTQMKPTASEPVTIDAADIDNNGTLDAILSYYIQGKSYPVATRDELLDQIPSLKVKFPSYEAYSDATVKDIFSKEQLAGAIHLEAEEFRSGIFINESGHFRFLPFTNEAQAFPVRDILVEDLNHDGLKDLLLAGNNYAVRAQWGRQDAGKGLLLTQNKGGGDGVAARVAGGTDGSPTGVEGNPAGVGFTVVHNTGFQADKDVRKMARIDNFILVANNNDKIQLFTIH